MAGTSVPSGTSPKTPAERSSIEPKTLAESGRGRQSHSTLPPDAISAHVSQSDRNA
jgi:hypothetical protein